MISDNNNNNNNNNNNFEHLFWKVIHNKYLFNLIIQKIQDINFTNCKFKDITSFCWLFGNGLFNLLIYKLKNHEINKPLEVKYIYRGICIILDFTFKGNFDLVNLRNEVEFDCHDSNITFIEDFEKTKDKMKLKLINESINEIFLSLKYIKDDIKHLNIIEKLIELGYNDPKKALKLLQILVVEQNIFQLTPHHFSLVLINFDLQFIKRFIQIANDSNSTIIDETFRNNSISLLLNKNKIFYTDKRIELNQDVLESILDNPEYHCQNYDPTIIKYENTFIYHNSYESFKSAYFKRYFGAGRERDIKYICDLRPSIQIKLMDLKYFNTFESIEFQRRLLICLPKDRNSIRKQRDLTNRFILDINKSDLDGLSKVKQVYKYLSKYSVCNSFKQPFK